MTTRPVTIIATLIATAANAIAGGTALTTERVALGLDSPTFVTHPPGDTDRLFILEQPGTIRILNLPSHTLQPADFLNITGIVSDSGNEEGLLGMAFHPDYENNGHFYLYFNNNAGNLRIARYTRINETTADPNSKVNVLVINHPTFSNHNGGWIGFGPNDDYLYIATGDGGASCGPSENSQNLDSLLGKILRVDVDGDDFPGDANRNYAIPPSNPFVGVAGADEVWAYGLRNPWRCAFDSDNGDFYIADVGQGVREEVNYQPAASAGGENYGWDCKEGTACATVSGCGAGGCACGDGSLIDPVYNYTHSFGCSISGGEVYRGCGIPDLVGTYFFADHCSARIWSFKIAAGVATEFEERTSELDPAGATAISSITSFGRDANGEVYICDRGGELFKIIPAVPIIPDPCAAVADCLTDADCADNDVCTFDQCAAGVCFNTPGLFGDIATQANDCGQDADVGLFDIFAVLDAFSASGICSDEHSDIAGQDPAPACEPDNDVGLFDIFAVLDAFNQAPPCPCP
jgi:glucose/arabinose dehydrogenase